MSRKREVIFVGIGILAGFALRDPAAQAATSITATLSTQSIYMDGQRVTMATYLIGGSNYVRLRDIGKAVGFDVAYDATTNSVHINTTQPYRETPDVPTSPVLEEETIRTALLALRDVYPTNTPYGTPYVPNNPLDRPYSNCDACAGWAMKCSDTVFGDLPWRQIMNPHWEDIRVGDLIDYRTGSTGHVVVILEKRDDMVIVTESGRNGKVRWGGQYPRWWLEQQSEYSLRTRYPQ